MGIWRSRTWVFGALTHIYLVVPHIPIWRFSKLSERIFIQTSASTGVSSLASSAFGNYTYIYRTLQFEGACLLRLVASIRELRGHLHRPLPLGDAGRQYELQFLGRVGADA